VKAVVYRGPGKVACEEVPYPNLPSDGLILRVEACGICGSDLRTYRYGLRIDTESQILGHEIAGVVAEVGRDVPDYTVGDRLAVAADVHCYKCYYCRHALYNLCEDWKLLGAHYPGGLADFMQLPVDILRRGIVHRIPDELSSIKAALAEPASSVIWAQQQLNIQPGEVVVIFGDGPIGALHVQIARARGAKPILIGLTGGRLNMFLHTDFGTWHVLDNNQEDVVARVRSLTDGLGADAAIVACAAKSAQAQAVDIVRKRGRIALFGGLPKEDPASHLDSNRIHYNEITIQGTFSYHPQIHKVALDLIARNLIEADKIITATYPLSQFEAGFQAAMNATELKVILIPDGATH
jgi:L-iditol 2-dehydrogenase